MSTNHEQHTLVRKQIIEEKVKHHQQMTGKQRKPFIPYKLGQHVYARKPPLKKGYTGPWEIVQVREGGSSYKQKHLRQQRWISQRAEHLKTAHLKIRPTHLKIKRT